MKRVYKQEVSRTMVVEHSWSTVHVSEFSDVKKLYCPINSSELYFIKRSSILNNSQSLVNATTILFLLPRKRIFQKD